MFRNKNWLTLMLLFVLAASIPARADGGGNGGGGSKGSSGDPDNPSGYWSGWRAVGVPQGGENAHPKLPWISNEPMRRYLVLLSGLRSFTLRF
jgi:hypothetical protein